jgi:hypothetical protein
MTDPGHADESAAPTAREEDIARRFLLAIVAGYVLTQFLLFSFDRAPRWDEAVYLSQVTPGADAEFFAPFRARGITLLIAPITAVGGSVAAVRLFLTAVSALAITATFWIWIPFIGMAAPSAALLFVFSWMGLLNGSEIFPNLLAATLGLAVTGIVCRWLAGEGRSPVVIASVLLAVLALFRPTDATAVFGVLGVYFLGFERSSWRVLLPIGLGLVVGWLPWVIEMSIRFGGPLTALDQAGTAHFALASVTANVRQYLSYSDGWVAGPEGHRIPLPGILWWGWLIVMAFVAISRKERASAHAAVLLCSLGALALVTQYVILLQDRALAPRYLLPAIAFASVPAAVGLVSLLRGGISARAAGVVALLVVLPWGIWQARVADQVEADEASHRESFRALGLALKDLADGRPCTFTSLRGTPQIAIASGCRGTQVLRRPTADDVARLSSSRYPAFVILPRAARPRSALGAMTPVLHALPEGKTWFIYRFPA